MKRSNDGELESWSGGVKVILLTWITKGLLWLALFTPLIVTHSTLFPFQVGKGIALRILIELAGFFYLWLVLIEPRARPVASRLLWSVVAYAGILVVTMLTGVDPYRSLWGDMERMEGVFGFLHGVLAFVIACGVFRTREQWIVIFRVSLAASVFVLWYALAQMYPWARSLPVHEFVDSQPGSTLGYASFAATYAVFQVFFAAFLIVMERTRVWKLVAGTALLMNLLLLSLTAIRGAQIALLAALVAGGVLFMFDAAREKRQRIAVGVVLVLCLGGFVGVRMMDGSEVLTKMPRAVQRMATISASTATAQTRMIALGVSWHAWQERPVLGWGPENFGAAYSRHFDPAILSLEDVWFDRPHNKVAEVAIHSGITGLFGYLAIFVFATACVLSRYRRPSPLGDRTLTTIVLMLGCAYFIQNLFLFDTAVSTLLFFLSLAFTHIEMCSQRPAYASASAGRRHDGNEKIIKRRGHWSVRGRTWILGAALLAVSWMIWSNVAAFRAAGFGLEGVRATDPTASAGYFRAALGQESYPTPEVVRTMLSTLVTFGRVSRKEWEPVTNAVQTEAERMDVAGQADHRLLEYQGKVYNRRGAPFLADAERVLRRAIAMAPCMHEARYELGVTLLRKGDVEGGLQLFREIVALNDRYAKGHWILGVALMSQKQEEEGKKEMRRAEELGYRR